MRKSDHRHILKLRRIYEDEKYVHLVMDHTEHDLFCLLKLGRHFNEQLAAQVIFNILTALDYLHTEGIMHCNVKPQSVMVDRNITDVYLTDFSLAQQTYTSRARRGSPGYAAPEIYTREYDAKADIFSAGVVLYSILSGTHPFAGPFTEDQSIIRRKIAMDLPFQNSRWRSISESAKNLI